MTKPYRQFALAIAISAAAFALPATSAVTTPDLSGRWGRNAFNFEPLPGGPRPVTNLRRLPSGIGDPNALVGDYNNPILKPEAAGIVKSNGESAAKGVNFPDPSNQCAPYAPPFHLAMQLGVEIFQTKDNLTMIFNQDDQVRHVRLNASHPANLTPSAWGDSVGHYAGDTLIIDTIGVKTGPVAVMDRYGTPRSEAFHLVERYKLIDYEAAQEAAERHQKQDGPAGLGGNVGVDPNYKGEGLQVTFTIEDPKFLTAPLTAAVTYRRIRGDWVEQVCAENTFEYYRGVFTAIPTAGKPDF